MAKSSSGKLFIAGLAGVAAGIAIGFLLAPESGSSTRKKIKKRLRKVSENFQERFSDEIDKLKSALHREVDDEPVKNPPKDRSPKT